MARKGKKGLDYFSHDVDVSTDKKIRMLQGKHGIIGYAVFMKLLEELYGEEGYFIKVDEDFLLLMADECRLDFDKLKEIVQDCVKRGLFHEEKYEEFGILTSSRIQRNYLEGTERRKEISLYKDYLLLNVDMELSSRKHDVYILGLNDDILFSNADIKKQKEKEKEKEKESKSEKENVNAHTSAFKNEISLLLRQYNLNLKVDELITLSGGDIKGTIARIKAFHDKGPGYVKSAIKEKYDLPKPKKATRNEPEPFKQTEYSKPDDSFLSEIFGEEWNVEEV